MTYTRGTYGLDTASAKVDYRAAVHSGSRYQFRYSAGAGNNDSSTQFKLCGRNEIASIVAAGCDFVANFELEISTPSLGFSAGQRSGAADLQFWQARGLNRGSSIYISWEPGNDSSQFHAVEQFISGYNQELSGHFVADALYAGIPALKALGRAGVIKHGWIPESTAGSDIPRDHWWIYQPTKVQLGPAMRYLDGIVAGSGLKSIIWQDGNKWFAGDRTADEDIVLLGGPIGSHLEASGHAPEPAAAPARMTAVDAGPDSPEGGPHFRQVWPGPALGFGTHDFFGNVNGPAASHGGAFANEQPYVEAIQDRLLWLGMVPNLTFPNGWADGVFDVPGHDLGGPTTEAVKRFQAKYRPGVRTTLPGQIWPDDWHTLFSVMP